MRSCLSLLLILFASPLAAAEHRQLARPDGSLIDYYLDRPAGPANGLLLLAQGSGCLPVGKSESLAAARAAFPDHIALSVEKVGVTPASEIVDGFTDCPSAFHDRYTISLRVSDYLAVAAEVRADPAIPDRLVLFGGSEGGLAVAMLAAELAPDATIILSSATGTDFGTMVLSTVPPEGRPTLEAAFAAARANPDSGEMFAGSSYRFWADMLDRRTLDYMTAASGPFLLIQGGRDTSSPLEAARATADAYRDAGLCNLTYFEFPALDHGMTDPSGTSHLALVAALAAGWAERPMPAC